MNPWPLPARAHAHCTGIERVYRHRDQSATGFCINEASEDDDPMTPNTSKASPNALQKYEAGISPPRVSDRLGSNRSDVDQRPSRVHPMGRPYTLMGAFNCGSGGLCYQTRESRSRW